jgi:hypothetical protein
MKSRARFPIFALCTVALAVWAEGTPEIEHLLDYIGGSQCTFVRNGEERDAGAAKAHIKRKYEYAKKWIETTEQFIEYTATKSSVSGEPYRVICSGREEPSADWLNRELARYRALRH